jgi:hypothetical protein
VQSAQLQDEHDVQLQEPQEQALWEQFSQVQSLQVQVAQLSEQLPQVQVVHSS